MNMTPVKGRRKNLIAVGWENHFLEVGFARNRCYRFGGVPEEVKDKLLRSMYPDHLFSQLVKNKYPSERLFTPPSKPIAPLLDFENLPF